MKELALVLFGELQLVILIPTIILLVSGVVSFGLFISVVITLTWRVIFLTKFSLHR